MLIANDLILYFAAAAKEAIGKPFYFLKYTDDPKNADNVVLIYYAALDGDRLILLHNNTDQFSTYHHKHDGPPEPFKIKDHQDMIRAIKHVYGLSGRSTPLIQ